MNGFNVDDDFNKTTFVISISWLKSSDLRTFVNVLQWTNIVMRTRSNIIQVVLWDTQDWNLLSCAFLVMHSIVARYRCERTLLSSPLLLSIICISIVNSLCLVRCGVKVNQCDVSMFNVRRILRCKICWFHNARYYVIDFHQMSAI